jgi:hypothetical protein
MRLDSRPAPIDPRLAAILGKLGSDHEGEIIAAARAAERIRAQMGATWDQLLGIDPPRIPDRPPAPAPRPPPPREPGPEPWQALAARLSGIRSHHRMGARILRRDRRLCRPAITPTSGNPRGNCRKGGIFTGGLVTTIARSRVGLLKQCEAPSRQRGLAD